MLNPILPKVTFQKDTVVTVNKVHPNNIIKKKSAVLFLNEPSSSIRQYR